MITPISETPEWLSWTSTEPLVVLQVWDGLPSLALIPTFKGALLWWMFDQDEDGSDSHQRLKKKKSPEDVSTDPIGHLADLLVST